MANLWTERLQKFFRWLSSCSPRPLQTANWRPDQSPRNLLRRASNFSSACFGSPVRRWQTVVSAKLKTRPNFERTQCTVCTIQHSGNRWNYCTHGSSGRLYRARHTRRVWCIYHGASTTVPLPWCLCRGASTMGAACSWSVRDEDTRLICEKFSRGFVLRNARSNFHLKCSPFCQLQMKLHMKIHVEIHLKIHAGMCARVCLWKGPRGRGGCSDRIRRMLMDALCMNAN